MPGELCKECGSHRIDGLDCWGQFGAVLAWEAHDAALAQVHFLTVATYNLQHPTQFTEAALIGLREAFIDHLDHDVAVGELRRRLSLLFEGSRRVLRPVAERHTVRRGWSKTIAYVYVPDRPAGAADRVRNWARSVRQEL